MRLRTGKCFVNFQVQCKLQDDCNLFSLMGIITLTMNYEIGFLFFKYLFIYLAASRTGIKPTFPVLGGGFPTTGLPGKSLRLDVYVQSFFGEVTKQISPVIVVLCNLFSPCIVQSRQLAVHIPQERFPEFKYRKRLQFLPVERLCACPFSAC